MKTKLFSDLKIENVYIIVSSIRTMNLEIIRIISYCTHSDNRSEKKSILHLVHETKLTFRARLDENLSKLEDTFHSILYAIVMDDGHRSRLNYNQQIHCGNTTQRDRIETFTTWRLQCPDPFVLSKIGFCFTGKGDKVQCCECSQTIDNWYNKANPLLEHYKINNGCVFVQNNREVLFNFKIKNDIVTKSVNRYASLKNRILSFKDVRLPRFLNIESLAHAGFHYAGPGDRVKCHSCDMVLVDWEHIDIPIAEHYRWCSDCDYIKQCLPKLDRDVDSQLKQELGPQQVSPEITRECETGYYLTENESFRIPESGICNGNRESFSLPESGHFHKKTGQSSNTGLGMLLNLFPNGSRECASSSVPLPSKPLKYPIQEGSYTNDRESISLPCEVFDETGNDEDELTATSACAKNVTSQEMSPSIVTQENRNDEDELTRMLNSDKVEAAKQIFGFSSYVLEEFIRRFYKQHHRDFESAAELCSALLEEQEGNQEEREKCDSSVPNTGKGRRNSGAPNTGKGKRNSGDSNKAETLPVPQNKPNTQNHHGTVTEKKENVSIPTDKTVERAEKEERLVSTFDSKMSFNSEAYVPCKICMDNEVQITFIPCRHLVTCEKCSHLVKECPICRRPIQDRMKIYLS